MCDTICSYTYITPLYRYIPRFTICTLSRRDLELRQAINQNNIIYGEYMYMGIKENLLKKC